MKNALVYHLALLIACASAVAQHECDIPSREVIFVDTIEIHDPIVLEFEEIRTEIGEKRWGLLLVPRCLGDTTQFSNGAQGYKKCLTTIGYEFRTPGMFQCFLRNMLYSFPKVQDAEWLKSLMQDMLKREKDSIWVESYYYPQKYKPVYYKGLESFEIRQRRFWLFLVKNSASYPCGIDERLRIEGNDNIYIRVLVPFFIERLSNHKVGRGFGVMNLPIKFVQYWLLFFP
jgi:hypothetical protein